MGVETFCASDIYLELHNTFDAHTTYPSFLSANRLFINLSLRRLYQDNSAKFVKMMYFIMKK